MRIKVPFEVALAIIVVGAVLWALIGVGALGQWLERKLSPRALKILARSIGGACTAGGLWLISTFFFITENRHPKYRGLYLFDLGDVALAAMLLAVGAAAFAWGRLRPLGVAIAFLGGAGLLLKPIALPLVHEVTWGSEKGTKRAFGLTSETHLYFVLSALGLLALGIILLVIALRKPQPVAGAAAPARGRAPFVPPVAARAPRAHERLIAAPEVSFDRLDGMMRQLCLSPSGAPTPSPAPGEPAAAAWTDGRHQVAYRYLPEHGLRLLDIQGPSAEYLRNDLLNMVYMPTLEGHRVSDLLRSADPREQMRGVLAAEHIGVNGNERYYIEPLNQLGGAAAPDVAQAAARVRGVLLERQRAS
jgi:hypothetical protein